jgi:hypothetical protein
MIYQDTKRFLKNHLKTPSIDYVWGDGDNQALIAFLHKRYSTNELQRYASELKEAFRDFFEPICKILINFAPEAGVKYKCIAYNVHPSVSKHLQALIAIIKDNEQYIQYPYEGKNDLICICSRIRRKINLEINDTSESINKRQLIKYAITKALELEKRDVVFYLKRKYLVKVFDTNLYLGAKREVEAPKKRNESVEKFNGYDELELQNHYDMLFEEYEIDEFLDVVVDDFFDQKMDLLALDANFFEKSAIRAIRDIFVEELLHYTDADEEYLTGFAGYVFRKHFEDVYLKIASVILDNLLQDINETRRFLNFYSGEVVMENGFKYQMPSLVKEDGDSWNIQSAISIVTNYLRAYNKKEDFLEEIDAIDEQLEELVESCDAYEAITTQIKQMKMDQLQNKSSLDRIKATKEVSNDSKVEALRQNLIQTQEEIRELESQQIEFQKCISQKNSLLAQRKKIEMSIKNVDQTITSYGNLYESILQSLAKALVQKKVKI